MNYKSFIYTLLFVFTFSSSYGINLNLSAEIINNEEISFDYFKRTLADNYIFAPDDTISTTFSRDYREIDMVTTQKILKGKLPFIRFTNDGSIGIRKIKYSKKYKRGSYKNPYLRDGDIINNNFLSASNGVLGGTSASFTGIFSTYGLIKAISD